MSETAVFRTGGRQFHVKVGDVLEIPRVGGEKGSEVAFDDVLLYQVPGRVLVGAPTVEGVRVFAAVREQKLGPKINGFKYKPKKHYKRAWGHRQPLTRIEVTAIEAKGAKPEPSPAEPAAE